MALFLRSFQIAFESLFLPRLSDRLLPSIQLAGQQAPLAFPNWLPDALMDAIWFAVPKRRVTRSKKRIKATNRDKLKLKENIITCPRTGEMTLRHKLPFKWRDFIPGSNSQGTNK